MSHQPPTTTRRTATQPPGVYPMKVCVHEKVTAEREHSERRERQIQDLCKEYYDLELRLRHQEEHHGQTNSQLQHELETVNTEVALLRSQNVQQCTKITELTAANAKLTQSLLTEQARSTELQSAQLERDTLQREMDARKFLISELKQKLDDATACYHALLSEHQQGQGHHNEVKDELRRQVEHNRQLVKSHNNTQSKLSKKEKEVAKAEVEKQSAVEETSRLQQRLQQVTQVVQQRDQDLVVATDGAKATSADIERLKRDRSRMKRELLERQQVLQDREYWLAEAKRENARLLSALFAYVGKYNDSQTWIEVAATPDTLPRTPVACPACAGTGTATLARPPAPPLPHQHPMGAHVGVAPVCMFASEAPPVPPLSTFVDSYDDDPHTSEGGSVQHLRVQNGDLLNRLVDSVTQLRDAVVTGR